MTKRIVMPLALVAAALLAVPATATHFRGAAIVPEIDANGVMTVVTTSFWENGRAPSSTPVGSTAGVSTSTTSSLDSTDLRYDRLTTTQTFDISNAAAQTIDLTYSGCCRVSPNGANWLESSWAMNSAIVWDGSSANDPIDFNFGAVQFEVSRLGPYSQNLSATSPDGLTLSYNQDLNLNITSQPEGFSINTSTGQMDIPGGSPGTADYNDNPTEPGADRAFSGNIIASDGSTVEFDWMFDGVDSAVNNAPTVSDGMLMGNPGDQFDFTFTITDPDVGDTLSLDPGFFGILGPAPANAPTFDENTGEFDWDSTGSTLGTYIFQVRGRDQDNATDVGSLTIELKDPNAGGGGGVIPEPASMFVWSCLAGLALASRRNR